MNSFAQRAAILLQASNHLDEAGNHEMAKKLDLFVAAELKAARSPKQRSVYATLLHVASSLDEKGFTKEADEIDRLVCEAGMYANALKALAPIVITKIFQEVLPSPAWPKDEKIFASFLDLLDALKTKFTKLDDEAKLNALADLGWKSNVPIQSFKNAVGKITEKLNKLATALPPEKQKYIMMKLQEMKRMLEKV